MSYLDDPNLAAARSNANQAQSAYGAAQQAAITLPDMLRESLSKKLGSENPVIAARDSSLKSYFDVAGAAPLNVTHTSAGGNSDHIFNPAQQQSLMTSQRGAALAPVSGLNALLGLEVGGMGDIIDSTGRAYQGVVTGLGNQAQSARQAYQDLFGELQARAQEEAAARAAEEDARRWGLNYDLDVQKLQKSGGSGSGGADFSSLIPFFEMMMGGAQGDSEWEDITDFNVSGKPGLDVRQATQSGGLRF